MSSYLAHVVMVTHIHMRIGIGSGKIAVPI